MPVVINKPPMSFFTEPTFDAVPMVTLPGKPVVSTHRQRRELMARHNKVDANDITPPSFEESLKESNEIKESVNAISLPDEAKGTVADVV